MSSGCGCKEVYILLIPTPLVSAVFFAAASFFVHLNFFFI